MKTGLIIQGPIISKGKSGKEAHLWNPESFDAVLYDSRKGFAERITVSSNIFDHIVIVTWKEDEKLLSELTLPHSIENVKILSVGAPKENPNVNNNSTKQFYSCLIGAKHLRKLGVDRVVKTRMDLTEDQLFFKSVLKSWKNEPLLQIPWEGSIWTRGAHDLIFGGQIDVFESVCSEMLRPGRTTTHPALLRCFYATLHKTGHFQDSNIKSVFVGCSSNFWQVISQRVYEHSFHMSAQSLSTLLWRGEPFSNDYLKRLRNVPSEFLDKKGKIGLGTNWSEGLDCFKEKTEKHIRSSLSVIQRLVFRAIQKINSA